MKKLNFQFIFSAMLISSVAGTAYAGRYGGAIPNANDTIINKSSSLSGHKAPKGASIDWTIQPVAEVKEINIQVSDDGVAFTTLTTLQPSATFYMHDWNAGRSAAHYRLEVLWKKSGATYTSSVFITGMVYPSSIVLLTNPVSNLVKLKVSNNTPQLFTAEWRNSQGTFMEAQSFSAAAGVTTILLTPPAQVTPGTYYLRVVSDDKKARQLFRIVKQ